MYVCMYVCMYVYLGNFSETLREVFLSQGIVTSIRVHFLTRLFLMTMSGRFAEIWTLVCCLSTSASLIRVAFRSCNTFSAHRVCMHLLYVFAALMSCTRACTLILFAYSTSILSFSGCSSLRSSSFLNFAASFGIE